MLISIFTHFQAQVFCGLMRERLATDIKDWKMAGKYVDQSRGNFQIQYFKALKLVKSKTVLEMLIITWKLICAV